MISHKLYQSQYSITTSQKAYAIQQNLFAINFNKKDIRSNYACVFDKIYPFDIILQYFVLLPQKVAHFYITNIHKSFCSELNMKNQNISDDEKNLKFQACIFDKFMGMQKIPKRTNFYDYIYLNRYFNDAKVRLQLQEG